MGFRQPESVKAPLVVIQINGLNPHVKASIQAAICNACTIDGFNITIEKQPANSPDFNISDLGFFHSLQKNVFMVKRVRDAEDIVSVVETAFVQYDWRTLERMWHSYFHLMDATLKCASGNDHSLPHSGTYGGAKP